MIEAVIWDFGGVFTTSPFEAFARFETERGLPPALSGAPRQQSSGKCLGEIRAAEVDIEAFDRLFRRRSLALGAEVRGKDVRRFWSGILAARDGRASSI